ncbi:MFS transporter [Pueribacillus sp. YX66]|uniref:MFS transporter n=1 Tax=Pueribacillus sp. YX66 TaxID=3229242 RepID=UPI00358D41CD
MIYFIYVIILVAFIDTFAQLPIISPFAHELGATPLLIGLAVGMYSFTNIIGNIFAGFWIDKNGAKRVLYIGLGITGLILLSYSLVHTPIQLILARFFHGLSGGLLVPAAFTYLANTSVKTKKGKSMALSGAIVGLAAVLGPAFGGMMTETAGVKWVFLIIGGLMLITALLAFLLLPQTEATMSRRIDSKETGKSIIDLLKNVPLFYAYLGSFALMFSQGVLAYMLPLKIEALNYGNEVSGMLMSTFAFTAILIFILPTNKLFDRFAHEYMLNTGLVILGIGLLLLSVTSQLSLLYMIMVIYGIGFSFIFPSINALIIQHTNVLDRGKAFGLFYAFFSLGVVVGSVMTGALAVTANGAFLIGTTVVLCSSFILFILIMQRKKASASIN